MLWHRRRAVACKWQFLINLVSTNGLKFLLSQHPMKFVPTNSSFVFEPITTPNKNIQSYFMRSEQSFFTPEHQKDSTPPDPPIQLLITESVFMVDGFKFEHDFILNNQLNLAK